MTPRTAAGRALLADPLYRVTRDAHETDEPARARRILDIEAESLPSADELARVLHDHYALRQGHEHDPLTCASLTPGGVDHEDATAILAALREP